MSEQERKQQRRYPEEVERIVAGLKLFDDTLMQMVFNENIPAAEHLLRVIMGKPDLTVTSVKGQENWRNPDMFGRSVRVDMHAVEASGVHDEVEVQNGLKGADPHRARFLSSALDMRMLQQGQKFKELKDGYVIFIVNQDYFGKGEAKYCFDRCMIPSGQWLGDGSHIIYVNGAYQGNDAIGELMHDFRQVDPDAMYSPVLAESMRYYKAEGGKTDMCEAIENYAKEKSEQALQKGRAEGREEGGIEMLAKLVKDKKIAEQDALEQLKQAGMSAEAFRQLVLKG